MSVRRQTLILVVEDEALVRQCAVAQLEDAGFAVIEAADAEEALRSFKDHAAVTTVFTDINMPGEFDGLSLAHQISQLRPGVQLILTSGRGAPLERELPVGGKFLLKPYDCNHLTALIKAA
ncbi:MAG TPA: response regulator [Caulobacteraceae bacterium]|jgi:CheY-like chemotaxis protein|nr:response regulator [Caulobacteraceae bacterium]